MFHTATLHTSLRRHDPLDFFKSISASHPDEYQARDADTDMSVIEHAAFQGRPDVVMETLLQHAIEQKSSHKKAIKYAEHNGNDLTAALLKIFAQQENPDQDLVRAVFFWSVLYTKQTDLLALLEPHFEVNQAADVKKPSTEKSALLQFAVTILPETKKIPLQQFKQDLFGLIELAAEQKSPDVALRLLAMNESECRLSDTIMSAMQWTIFHDIKPLADYFNKKEHDVKKIFVAAKKIAALELDEKKAIAPEAPEDPEIQKVHQAYEARDFVKLQRIITHFHNESKSILLFKSALAKWNRGLFFILMFATNQYPADLAPYFVENFSDFMSLLRFPNEKNGILLRMMSQDTRGDAKLALQQKKFGSKHVSRDEWISAYFKYLLVDQEQSSAAKKALRKKPEIQSEEEAIAWLTKNNLLSFGFVEKLSARAEQTGLAFPNLRAFFPEEKSDRNSWQFFFAKSFGPSALVMPYLDDNDYKRFACVSKNFYRLTLSNNLISDQVFALNHFLDYLNDCVVQYGFRRRYADLPFKQKAWFWFGVITSSGILINSILIGHYITAFENLGKNMPECQQYDAASCAVNPPDNFDTHCIDYCNNGNAFNNQILGTSISLAASFFSFLMFIILETPRCNKDPAIFYLHRALFSDLSDKPIETFSKSLPAKARRLIFSLQGLDHKLTEKSSVTEFREAIPKLKQTILATHAQQRFFAAKKSVADNKSDTKDEPTQSLGLNKKMGDE